MRRPRINSRKNISGARIAALRQKMCLTQLALSHLMRDAGVPLDRAAVAKIENGMRHVADFELIAFAMALHTPVSRLLTHSEKPSRRSSPPL